MRFIERTVGADVALGGAMGVLNVTPDSFPRRSVSGSRVGCGPGRAMIAEGAASSMSVASRPALVRYR
ncbi:MAG: hypothetical protein Ct9H300mP12_01330 [Acidimicrobiales bacterium]|nr:MAG: hypothetical protein Ct9H300mP12_01330 [Acidimicrobiales bacterium]